MHYLVILRGVIHDKDGLNSFLLTSFASLAILFLLNPLSVPFLRDGSFVDMMGHV